MKAQYQDNRWLDRDSNISREKESYFIDDIAPKLKTQLSQKKDNNHRP